MDKKELVQIKANLRRVDLERKQDREVLRSRVFEEVKKQLLDYFSKYPQTRVYLFGSVVTSGMFSSLSDVDIAVENYPGNRLDLYAGLSALIAHSIDVVIMERCVFAAHIRQHGKRIQ